MTNKEMKIYINILKHRGSFLNNVNSFISINNGDEYLNLIKAIFSSDNIINRNSFFHSNYNEVLDFAVTGKNNNTFKMLLWSSCLITYFKKEIIDFVSKKKKFDYSILMGDYETAERELSYIESNISFSIWSLKSRMLLANLNGLKKDEYLEMLGSDKYVISHANLFAHLTSEDGDINQYTKNVDYIAKSLPEDYVNCFLYLFSEKDDFEIDDYATILEFCNAYSIIDSFLCVKHIVHKLLSKNIDNSQLRKVINNLFNIINDDEILFFYSYVYETGFVSSNGCEKLIDDFSAEKYKDIFLKRKSYFKNIMDCSLIKLNIIALSGILSDEITQDEFSNENIVESILFCLYNILIPEDALAFKLSMYKIDGLCRSLKWFDLAIPLRCFYKNSLSYIQENIAEKCYSCDDMILFNKISNLEFPPIFFESLYYYLSHNISYNDIEKEFSSKYKNIYRISYLYILYYIALKQEDYKYCVEVFSKSISDFKALVYRFDADKLCKYVTENITIRETVNICDVIFSYSIEELKKLKHIAYKNFLDENRICKPLEIVETTNERKLITYFLKEICTVDTMAYLYFTFSSSNELENHRVEICKYLLENDVINKSTYSKEISDILKEQEVKKLKKTIDKSKLSIDYSYVKEKIYNDFLELTKQYYATKSNAYEYVGFDSPMVISADPKSWEYIALSRDVILEKMYKIYASEFCFGSRGLDTYLSTRVRHGTFENTIKKVFIENCLYNTDNNFFKPLFSKNQVSKDIESVINAFREELLVKIKFLTNVKFKVFIETVIENALFNYWMQTEDVVIIYNHLAHKERFLSVMDFIDIISDSLTIKTNNYLSYIRDVVLEDLKKDIIVLLDKLNNDVEDYCIEDSAYSNIRDKISRCKTNIQNKIDEIKNWFYLSESIPMENYSMENLVEVLNKNMYQQFDDFGKIDLTINNFVSKMLVGETFVYIYDVLQILFSNAIIHSKFDDLKDLKIVFDIYEVENDRICFSLKNNFSEKCDLNCVNDSIEKINRIYNNKEYTRVDTHKEGGMGQIKVLDILYNVLNVGESFLASCDSEKYQIIIMIKQKGVIDDA